MEKNEIAQEAGWEDAGDADRNPDAKADDALPLAPSQLTTAPVQAEPIESTELLDAEDKVSPKQISTERPSWRHPGPRTAFVAIIAAAIGLVVVRITMGNGLLHPQQNQVVVQAPTPTPQPTAQADRAGERDAKLATIELEHQMDAVKKARAKPTTSPEPAPKAPTPAPTPAAFTSAAPTPAPITPAPVIPVRRLEPAPPLRRPIPRTFTPEPRPAVVAYNPPVARPVIPPVAKAPTQPPKDPQKAWLEAANAGRAGGGMSPTIADTSRLAIRPGAAGNFVAPDGGAEIAQPRPTIVTANSSVSLPSSGTGLPPTETDYQGTSAQLQTDYQPTGYSTDPSAEVMVGTRASARLETPIAWSSNGSQDVALPNVRLRLLEPLKAADGKEALPAGAYLLARVNSADTAGPLQLSPFLVQFTLKGQIIRKPLIEGAVLIFGKGGKPLKAKFHRPRGGSNVLSTLSNAAGIAGLATNNSGLYVLNALQQSRQGGQLQSSYFSLEDGQVDVYINEPFSL